LSDKDQIKELFSEKLGNFEAKVNPELWTNIASQVGTATTSTAAAGSSLLTKVIIGVSSAAVLTTGIVLYSNSVDDKPQEKETAAVTENRQDNQQSKEDKEKTISVTPNEGTQKNDNTSVDTQPQNVQEIPSVQNNQGPAIEETDNDQAVLNENDQAGGNKSKDKAVNETAISEKENPKADKEEPKTEKQEPKVTPQDNLAQEDDPLKDVPATNPKENKEELKPFKLENLSNIFTPDGDGNNDEFFLELPALKSFQIVIMDQNGQTVFESNDQNFRWNGTNMRTGNRVMKGIHSYIIIAENEEGQVVKANEFLMVNF